MAVHPLPPPTPSAREDQSGCCIVHTSLVLDCLATSTCASRRRLMYGQWLQKDWAVSDCLWWLDHNDFYAWSPLWPLTGKRNLDMIDWLIRPWDQRSLIRPWDQWSLLLGRCSGLICVLLSPLWPRTRTILYERGHGRSQDQKQGRIDPGSFLMS